jgi:hypothetical protein
MRVFRFVTGLAIAGIAAVVAAMPGSAATAPRSQLTGFACVAALDPGARAVGVNAVMRPLPGTRKLAIRFELSRRETGTAAQAVQGGDLGVWRSPANSTLGRLPGDVWRLQKSVYNLDAPFTYQFRVSFRWTGAHGKVLGTATRDSRTCRQRELRPDLTVKSIAVSSIAGHPKKALYTAIVANQGRTGAGPFSVLFVPGDSSAPSTQVVSFLGAGKTRTLSFAGPACTADSPPTVTADSASQVDDFDRANNQLTAVCPAAPSS